MSLIKITGGIGLVDGYVGTIHLLAPDNKQTMCGKLMHHTNYRSCYDELITCSTCLKYYNWAESLIKTSKLNKK